MKNKTDKILDRFERAHRKLASLAVIAAMQHEVKPTRRTTLQLKVLLNKARLLAMCFRERFGTLSDAHDL